MNFQFTEEQFDVAQAARDFAREILSELNWAVECTKARELTPDPTRMGELVFLGMFVDLNHGGMPWELSSRYYWHKGQSIYDLAALLSEHHIDCLGTSIWEDQSITSFTENEKLELNARFQRSLHKNEVQYIFDGTNGYPSSIIDDWPISQSRSQILNLTHRQFDATKARGQKNAIAKYNVGKVSNTRNISDNTTPLKEQVKQSVFVSYSHQDASYLERLKKHFVPLQNKYEISLWCDTDIKPGELFNPEILKSLNKASVAVLMVSADFLASDFIRNNELPLLLKAGIKKGKTIIPVIVSPCRFLQEEMLSQFQAINPPSKPLSKQTFTQKEETYVKIVDRIEQIVK